MVTSAASEVKVFDSSPADRKALCTARSDILRQSVLDDIDVSPSLLRLIRRQQGTRP